MPDRLGCSKNSATKGNSSKQKHLRTMPRQLSRLEVLCCDQATVAMRPGAGLAGIELALLSRGGTTCGTSDSEYLLRREFFFHSRGRILQALWPSLHASAPSQGFRLRRRADVTSQGVLDTACRMRRLRLPPRLVPCQKGSAPRNLKPPKHAGSAKHQCQWRPARTVRPQAISRWIAWRRYRLICSMDGQLFRTT